MELLRRGFSDNFLISNREIPFVIKNGVPALLLPVNNFHTKFLYILVSYFNQLFWQWQIWTFIRREL